MNPVVPKPQRCAIYTRTSSEHNLDLEFNSLDASVRPARPVSRARPIRAGASTRIATSMAGCSGPRSTALPARQRSTGNAVVAHPALGEGEQRS
jgi:hypothetical protein